MRVKMLRILLVLFFVAVVAAAVPIAFDIGRAGDLGGTTSGRVLAAALVSLGIVALGAAHDPLRHRLEILALVLFAGLTSLAMAVRLLSLTHADDPVAYLMPFTIAYAILLAGLCPWDPSGGEPTERS